MVPSRCEDLGRVCMCICVCALHVSGNSKPNPKGMGWGGLATRFGVQVSLEGLCVFTLVKPNLYR